MPAVLAVSQKLAGPGAENNGDKSSTNQGFPWACLSVLGALVNLSHAVLMTAL